jgi:hypothetical protein
VPHFESVGQGSGQRRRQIGNIDVRGVPSPLAEVRLLNEVDDRVLNV